MLNNNKSRYTSSSSTQQSTRLYSEETQQENAHSYKGVVEHDFANELLDDIDDFDINLFDASLLLALEKDYFNGESLEKISQQELGANISPSQEEPQQESESKYQGVIEYNNQIEAVLRRFNQNYSMGFYDTKLEAAIVRDMFLRAVQNHIKNLNPSFYSLDFDGSTLDEIRNKKIALCNENSLNYEACKQKAESQINRFVEKNNIPDIEPADINSPINKSLYRYYGVSEKTDCFEARVRLSGTNCHFARCKSPVESAIIRDMFVSAMQNYISRICDVSHTLNFYGSTAVEVRDHRLKICKDNSLDYENCVTLAKGCISKYLRKINFIKNDGILDISSPVLARIEYSNDLKSTIATPKNVNSTLQNPYVKKIKMAHPNEHDAVGYDAEPIAYTMNRHIEPLPLAPMYNTLTKVRKEAQNFYGVMLNQDQKYNPYLFINNERVILGQYDTGFEAAIVYDIVLASLPQLINEHQKLNFVNENPYIALQARIAACEDKNLDYEKYRIIAMHFVQVIQSRCSYTWPSNYNTHYPLMADIFYHNYQIVPLANGSGLYPWQNNLVTSMLDSRMESHAPQHNRSYEEDVIFPGAADNKNQSGRTFLKRS